VAETLAIPSSPEPPLSPEPDIVSPAHPKTPTATKTAPGTILLTVDLYNCILGICNYFFADR